MIHSSSTTSPFVLHPSPIRSSRVFDSAFRFLYPWTVCHGHEVVVEGAWSNIYQTLTPSFWTSANQVGPVSSRTSLAIPPLPRFSWAHIVVETEPRLALLKEFWPPRGVGPLLWMGKNFYRLSAPVQREKERYPWNFPMECYRVESFLFSFETKYEISSLPISFKHTNFSLNKTRIFLDLFHRQSLSIWFFINFYRREWNESFKDTRGKGS